MGATGLLGLHVCDHEERLQELGVIQPVLDVERVFNRDVDTVDLREDLEHLDDLDGRLRQLHDVQEVEQSLKRDHEVLLALIQLVETTGIIIEILQELQMIYRHERHSNIEVLFLLVESDLNSPEVDLQPGNILLLLHDDLLLFSSQSSLLLLKFDLRFARFLLPFPILIFLLLVAFFLRLG